MSEANFIDQAIDQIAQLGRINQAGKPASLVKVLSDGRVTKRIAGIAESMAIRAAFLADASHQIVFHYTPKHASWMNQIEIV